MADKGIIDRTPVGGSQGQRMNHLDARTDVDVRISGGHFTELTCVLHELGQAARPPDAVIL